jgi:hypothetical protein
LPHQSARYVGGPYFLLHWICDIALCGVRHCNEDLPVHTRIKAAVEALPFVHPKLAVTAMIDGRDFGAKLEKAIERSQTKMIEAKVEKDFVELDL